MRTFRLTLVPASFGLALFAPPASAQDCIPAELAGGLEGTDIEICPEEDPCPCFSADEIDAAFDGLSDYAYTWTRRPWGVEDQTSLRGDAWECTTDGWIAPTTGFDTWIDVSDCTDDPAYYCESWKDTWRAAPYHSWADDGSSEIQEITADEFDTCEALLLDWIDNNGTPTSSW